MASDIATASHSDAGVAARRLKHVAGRIGIYVALVTWAFISLFPVYWTITTSMKVAKDVQLGRMIPYVDFQPNWLGWRSLGLSPDTIGNVSTVRDEFLNRFLNSIYTAFGASALAVVIGALAAYGLSRFTYKFLWMKNQDLSFFFLSQLILPPVVLALPFLVLASEDGAARVYNSTSARLLATLRGHLGALYDARFSPDGAHVATASADGTARLWVGTSGDLLTTWAGHRGAVRTLAFSPDGELLATGGDDGVVRVVPASLRAFALRGCGLLRGADVQRLRPACERLRANPPRAGR